MSTRSKRSARDRRDEKKASESVRQAIERAAHHAGLALAEGVASARALLDAASIGVSGESAQSHQHLSEFAEALDQFGEALSDENLSLSGAALSALQYALDAEISRWEVRSRKDADARAVLRAFLGLREFLWELGVRPTNAESDRASTTGDPQRSRDRKPHASAGSRPSGAAARRTPRVQRIKIDG